METYRRKLITPTRTISELERLTRERDYPRPLSISSGSYEDCEEEGEEIEDIVFEEEPAPVLSLWEEVTKDYEEQRVLYFKAKAVAEIAKSERAKLAPASVYLAREILPELIPALEDTLKKAEEANCLDVQKCRYNGIDNIAEYLWNKNSNNGNPWLTVFEIPPFKEWLRDHPRPIFPLSWLWTQEEAALIIQRNVRGYFVRRHDEVQEMRKFWKAFRAQKLDEEERKGRLEMEKEEEEKKVSPKKYEDDVTTLYSSSKTDHPSTPQLREAVVGGPRSPPSEESSLVY